MNRAIIVVGVLLALAVPASAAAVPYLTVGNARYELEKRFEREEVWGYSGIDELLNCYRVSRTHVNCYSAEHQSAASCEEWLWRVWESATPQQAAHHKFTMYTKGHRWGPCPEEENEEEEAY